MNHILIIDDDESVRDGLEDFFKKNDFKVTLASNGQAGIDLLKEEKFTIFLVDLVMPGMGGLEVVREASALHITTPAIVITAYGTVQTAVEAMRTGAFDYITKPFVLDELMLVVNRAIGVSRLQQENLLLKMQLKRKYDFKGIIGNSPPMQKVYEMIGKIADTDSTVLITGESGTGKELVAKTIHYNNSYSQGPFVPLNCAAIPKDLLESELFGHEKGAFTGALNTRIGRFELAHNGTLFLDEIVELAPSLQGKLLRVLQEKEFERVGGAKTIKTNARIIAATNKDIEKAVKEGAFREDLFYRLNVIPLHIPSLRRRGEDMPLLIDHFVHELAKKKKRKPLRFSHEAMECLLKYRWPGNVRELTNLIERLTILVSGDTVMVSDLPEKFDKVTAPKMDDIFETFKLSDHGGQRIDIPDNGIDLNTIMENIEKNLILKTLEKTGGVKNKAAKLLGLNRTTLIEKMKKKEIEFQKL
ncbi:MAG: sigma-54-dependent Fis family transcriptional regulator [Desulfobacterales bacterium]|nr:sigma-54-dependent Fis family transcriptional regulator [Desulfobacterales bacterium]